MLRLAKIFLIEASIRIDMLIHYEIVFEEKLDKVEAIANKTRKIREEALRYILNGFTL